VQFHRKIWTLEQLAQDHYADTIITCILYLFRRNPHMNDFGDLSIEEFSTFDFVEEMNENLFEEEDNSKSFDTYLNSKTDY
jgi:hypothetical protein